MKENATNLKFRIQQKKVSILKLKLEFEKQNSERSEFWEKKKSELFFFFSDPNPFL